MPFVVEGYVRTFSSGNGKGEVEGGVCHVTALEKYIATSELVYALGVVVDILRLPTDQG